MFRVERIDGPNLTTDRGCIQIVPFQYADGGRTQPVSDEDWRKMRALFIAAPDLLAACKDALAHLAPFVQEEEYEGEERWACRLNDVLAAAIAKATGC